MGDFNKDYVGVVYLFEECFDDEVWCKDVFFFGNFRDVISIFDMIEEVCEDYDKCID